MMSCSEARGFIVDDVRGAGDDARREAVRDHVAGCEACRAEQARWSLMSDLRAWSPPSLPAAARERVVAGLREAAREADARRPIVLPRANTWAPWLVAAGAAAALLAGVVRWRHVARPPAQAPSLAVAPAPARDVIAFGGAELRYAADTRVRLSPATREIALDGGDLDVTAPDPEVGGAPMPLTVVAPRYRLVIRQAHVRIAADVIRVVAGSVEVFAGDGKLLTLASGSEWHVPPPPPPPSAPAPVAAPAPSAPMARHATVDARALYDEARAALVRGDAVLARRLGQRAVAAAPAAVDRARAELLVADAYLVEGDHDRAARAYLDVAAAHPALDVGETAAFAGAQLLWEGGRSDEARAAMQEYLRRYPDGRFVEEARERLATSSPAR